MHFCVVRTLGLLEVFGFVKRNTHACEVYKASFSRFIFCLDLA